MDRSRMFWLIGLIGVATPAVAQDDVVPVLPAAPEGAKEPGSVGARRAITSEKRDTAVKAQEVREKAEAEAKVKTDAEARAKAPPPVPAPAPAPAPKKAPKVATPKASAQKGKAQVATAPPPSEGTRRPLRAETPKPPSAP